MRQFQNRGNRTGAVVLETIIGLPILVLALMAIIEFGLLSSRQAIVHAASRAGADAAAAYESLPAATPIPVEVTDAVDRVLAPMGIKADCIRLEHTVEGVPASVLVSGSGASAPSGPVPSSDYVRLSVCIENTQLAPNLLSIFFLNLENTFSQHTTCRCVGD